MSDVVIRVDDLAKRYRLGERAAYGTLRDTLTDVASRPLRRIRRNGSADGATNEEAEIWALKGISFEVHQGEIIGIIGRNGSGKSTLLKILSMITAPTRGKAETHGVVNSLLEVGTGFHPELTGRENVFLNGAILGMSRLEIAAKFDEIVAFSEIEDFLDTPVKHYSSGMRLRLAFSVAAHLEPEILIIDEVLAVGDIAFQKKCIGKIGQVSRSGRTVLIVSHAMNPVANLCNRAIWLNDGEIAMQGRPLEVIAGYLSSESATSGEQVWPDGLSLVGVDELKVLSMRVLNEKGEIVPGAGLGQRFFIEIAYRICEPLPRCRVGFVLLSSEGVAVFESYDADDPSNAGPREAGTYVARCEIPGHLLNTGRYMLSLRASMPDKPLVASDNVLTLHTGQGRKDDDPLRMGQQRRGVIWPHLAWECTRVDDGLLQSDYLDSRTPVLEAEA